MKSFLSKSKHINTYMQQNQFSGTILVAKDGKFIFKNVYGMADNEQKIENKLETKFRIGSITKQFTSMAIMMLQEKKLLNVHDPISKYIPDYPHGDKITIHHLLTHSSGIYNYTSLEGFTDTVTEFIALDDLIKLFKDKPLEFEIGTKFSYCNSGYVLLTFIIERVSGLSYEAFLKQNIFEPLGMSNTGYYRNENPPTNDSSGHTLDKTGKIIKTENWHMSQSAGAGALYSTAQDLFIWDQALYTEKLVSKKSLNQIFGKHYCADDRHISYGWFIKENFEKTCIYHGGVLRGFIALISRYIDDNACVITLSNLDVSCIEKINKNLAAIIFDKPID